MSVKSGQAVTVDFTTANPTTGAAADADALPTATLVVNGTDNAATVTVTNKATGVYKAAVTLPTLGAGDVVSLRVAATVATIAGVGVVWTDTVDTKRVSDLKDEAMRGTDGALTDKTGFSLTAAYDAAKSAASQASVDALPTDADVQAAAQAAIVAQGVAQEATAQAIKAHTDTLDAATGIYPLTFRLLLDSDGDGHPDDPPVGVGGVTCHLLAHETATRIRESQTTDSQGYAYWHGLAAGTYDVDPDAAGYEGVTVAVTVPE
ncbi:MAG: SdrD B-like domain-containing protein [Desulfuromonadaceae bacterium]|nr:SdrD B-like domain-containing protein [Desulfuromonadaceae bacterium]